MEGESIASKATRDRYSPKERSRCVLDPECTGTEARAAKPTAMDQRRSSCKPRYRMPSKKEDASCYP